MNQENDHLSDDDDSELSDSDMSSDSDSSHYSSDLNDQYYCSDDESDTLLLPKQPGLPNNQSKKMLCIVRKAQRTLPIPIYTFQPFRIVECKYKLRCKVFSFPCSRVMHRVVATDTHLYSLGGYNVRMGVRPLRELWAYNYATQRWRPVAERPRTRGVPKTVLSHSMAMYKDQIISFGGTDHEFGRKPSREVFVYDIKRTEKIVNRLPVSGSIPRRQFGSGIAVVGDYLYKIGGTTSRECCNNVYRLDLKEGDWTLVNKYALRPGTEPIARFFHQLVAHGDYIYVLGGGTEIRLADMKSLRAFNTKTNKWEWFTTVPDPNYVPRRISDLGYPHGRNSFACAHYTHPDGSKEVFIVGGWRIRPQQSRRTCFLNDAWKLNLNTKQWTYLKDTRVPYPIHQNSASQTSYGCMYMFGGVEYQARGHHRVNRVDKMWMTIPKLSEIAWDALTYYFDFENVSSTILKTIGIPISFINRLKAV